MTMAAIVGLALQASMFLVVLSMALRASLSQLAWLVRQPGKLLISLVSMHVVMVAVALLADVLLVLPPPVEVALIAIALSPVPPVLPIQIQKAEGDTDYGLGLVVASAIAAFLIVPLSAEVIARGFGREIHVSARAILPAALVTVLVPVALGLAIHRLAPDFARRAIRPIQIVGFAVLAISLIFILVGLWPLIRELVGHGEVLVFTAVAAIGLGTGHLLGGPDPRDRTVLALATAARHPGIAAAIGGTTAVGQPHVLAAVLLYFFLGALLALPYVAWRARSMPGPVGADGNA
jgi:BASS family bile acid:Na+ symporter